MPVDTDKPAVRSYSISGYAPGEYRISVKREANGLVSGYLHASLTTGSPVEIASPRGEFVLTISDEPVLLASVSSPREVWWIHIARDQAHVVFAAEATDLLGRLEHGHHRIFLTATEGRPDASALRSLGLPPTASAYVCGPEGFMSEMRAALLTLGSAAGSIHSEAFGARGAINPGVVATAHRAHPAPHPPPGPPGDGPQVTFARSGLSVPWSASPRTLLDFAESCAVPTQWSCRTGVCHTCSTAVLSGHADYVTAPLDPPPADQLLICCAVPAQDLVLDL